MTPDERTAIRAALEKAIAAAQPVSIVVRLDSGTTREVGGVVTGIYAGRDGRERIGLLVGEQTQQALLVDSITAIVPR